MNTNQQTVHQMGLGISSLVKQATGRESVSNIEMDWVSVEQLARYIYGSGSGDVVSFNTNIPDAIDSLIAFITAVQDLHGYDNPWPGGGGKNKYNDTLAQGSIRTADGTTSSNQTRVRTVDGTVLSAGTYTISCTGANKGNAFFYDAGGTYVDCLDVSNMSVLPYSFTLEAERLCKFVFALSDDGNIVPTDVTNIQIEYGSSDTSFAPYSNICPITGWTGCNVTRCRKNLMNPDTISLFAINADGTLGNDINFSHSALIPVTGSAVVMSFDWHRNGNRRIHEYDKDGNWIKQAAYQQFNSLTDGTRCHLSATLTSNTRYVAISFATLDTNIQLELGSTETDFEEYQGETYAFTFPDEAGTVYGGTLDVLSGVLTVTHAGVDMGALTWEKHNATTSYYFKATAEGIKEYLTARTQPLLSSIYKNITDGRAYADVPNCSIYNAVVAGAYKVCVIDTAYETAEAFTTAVTGQTLVYELAEPVTYQLTAQEVTALIGQNTIFADTGNVSVQYKVKEDLV